MFRGYEDFQPLSRQRRLALAFNELTRWDIIHLILTRSLESVLSRYKNQRDLEFGRFPRFPVLKLGHYKDHEEMLIVNCSGVDSIE